MPPDPSTPTFGPGPYDVRDDVMQGVPDSRPEKRRATVSVEDLRSDAQADIPAVCGTLGLAWVGIHEDEFVLDLQRLGAE